VSIKHFIAFLGLTFLISWGIPGTGLLLSRLYSGFPFRLDMYSPLYYAGVWGPPVAAILVIGYVQGLKGLAAFLRRLLDWRFPVRWWVFAVLGIPLLYFLAAVGHWLTDTPGAMTGWNLSVAYFLGSTLARASAGPVEELGWRGFAVPLLQRRLHPWTVILVVTLLHSLWHAPVFLIGQFAHFGTSLPFGLALLRFTLQILAITVIFSIAYNATAGSLTLAVLIHLMLNLAYPWKADVDLLTGQTVMLGLAALLMVALVGKRWLHPTRAATAITPGVPEAREGLAGRRRGVSS
jgi:uncharacterized protein